MSRGNMYNTTFVEQQKDQKQSFELIKNESFEEL